MNSYSKQNFEIAVIKAYHNQQSYDPTLTEKGIKEHLQQFGVPLSHIKKIKIIHDKSKAYITFNDYKTYLHVLQMSFLPGDREQYPGSHPHEFIPSNLDLKYICQKMGYFFRQTFDEDIRLHERLTDLDDKINTLQYSINTLQNSIDIIQNNYNQNNYNHINNNSNHNNNNSNQKRQIHQDNINQNHTVGNGVPRVENMHNSFSELNDTLKGFTGAAKLLIETMTKNNQQNINNNQQYNNNNNNDQISPTQK